MAEMSEYYKDIMKIYNGNLPWSKLSESRILITGATGLIGRCLVEALLLNPCIDYHIYASSRSLKKAQEVFRDYNDNPFLHLMQYDVRVALKSNIPFDFIVHAASEASPGSFVSIPVEIILSNILGVSNLIEYGLNNGMKRFLYISSGEIYGQGDGSVFSETYSGYVNCVSPRACYPSSKRAAESLCVSYKVEYGVDVVIARPCHVYGPFFTESDNRVYAQFIRNVINKEDIIMKSSGDQYRSWCYVVDCVSGLLHILLNGESGEAYNIANPSSNVTIKELANLIATIGRRKVIHGNYNELEKKGYNPVDKSVFSVEKLQRLGWAPFSSLREGMEHTINALI